MTTQLLIVCLCVVSGTFTGLFLSKKLVKRAEYFKGTIAFINTFMSEVRFRKQPAKQIITEFSNHEKSLLQKDLSSFFDENVDYEVGKGLLNTAESIEIKKLLESIGTLDSETQLFELENYKQIFTNFYNLADEKRLKFASTYIKLGFFVGLLVGIILL